MRNSGTLRDPVLLVSFLVPHLEAGDPSGEVVLSNAMGWFMQPCRHLRVVRHLMVLTVMVRVLMIHNRGSWVEVVTVVLLDHRSILDLEILF